MNNFEKLKSLNKEEMANFLIGYVNTEDNQ